MEKTSIPEPLANMLGTSEEVIEKIKKAESKGNLYLAFQLAYDATRYGHTDLSDKVEELRKRIPERQKEILDAASLGEVRIRPDGFFDSVCCQQLKEAVIRGDVSYATACMTGELSLVLTTEELIVAEIGYYDGDDYCETDRCPYCKKLLYEE